MAASTRLTRAARRAQLIESAAASFQERGYDKTSMDQIAQAAGVSRLIVLLMARTGPPARNPGR